MQIVATFGLPSGGIERPVCSPYKETGLNELYLKKGEPYAFDFAVPSWGICGIRLSLSGSIGFIPDETNLLEILASSDKLSAELERSERKAVNRRVSLHQPKAEAREITRTYWHLRGKTPKCGLPHGLFWRST